MKSIIFILITFIISNLNANDYSLRKYSHVANFYGELSQDTISLCLKNNIPPAAILAIAGYESGYGTGYVSEISANILSLNATSRETELPALYLARNISTNKILFDKRDIRKVKSSNIIWQQRPASLKKDYRPASIAGTRSNLTYFRDNPKAKKAANLRCINDFITKRLSYNTTIRAYSNAKSYLDSMVTKHGKKILFDYNLNITFINKIGGKRNSYNANPIWPSKVINLMDRAGLVDLSKELYKSNNFSLAWGNYEFKSNKTYSKKSSEHNYVYKEVVSQFKTNNQYDIIIANVAKEFNLSDKMLKALIWKKSSFNSNLEKNGGIGLMQITHSAANHWAKENGYRITKEQLRNPSLNIKIGAWYLKKAKNYWKNYNEYSDTLALLEFNLGRQNMNKYIKIYSKSDIRIQSSEIQEYMAQIINRYSLYITQG